MPNFWSDPVGFLIQWLTNLLTGLGLSPELVKFLLAFLGAALLPLMAMLFVVFLIWYERKLYARMQDRFGPNRLGPWGIFQTFADMGKIFTKEIITPAGVDLIPFNLAPILAVGAVLLVWAVMPLAPRIVGVDLSVGLIFVIAAGGFGELAIMLAGWGSNNKYALLGGFRAVALLLSYEVPMVIAMLIPAMLAGSLNLVEIVASQDVPYLLLAPVAALIFFITQVAESGRAPFDLVEAESELVAGYNTEYSGLKFGMFYVAEFLHAFTSSMLFVTLFLGGYRGPFANEFPLLGLVYLMVKTFIVYFVTILFRGALPRFRIDQMLDLNWKVLTPLILAMVFVTALVDKIVVQAGGPLLVRTIVLFVVNMLIFWFSSKLLQRNVRPPRRKVSVQRPLATANVTPSASQGQDNLSA
ncbi:MAG: NADH-quinone oxidoreductase subunit NuoH [Chloroflexi bacterium]|nr:NADH-quinone oxidoreductase subunit NuoH [Chloroflexota bacterium]